MSELRLVTVNITPAIAQQWLDEWNIDNRPVSKGNVAKLASMIRDGLWLLSGEPITFSARRLIQGQHRLLAIIEAGIAVQSVVVWNAPDAAYDILDQGRRRTAGDVIAARGHTNANTVAGMMRYLWCYEQNRGSFAVQRYDKYRYADVANRVTDKHIEAVQIGRKAWVKGAIRPAMASACVYVTMQIDPVLAQVWWADFGSDPTKGHNANMLKTKMLKEAATKRKPTEELRWFWIVNAWNAERTGKQASAYTLRWVATDQLARFQ